MPRANIDKSVGDMTERLIGLLSSQTGIYSVQEGVFCRTDPFALCDGDKLPSCFGNNADSPYFSCALGDAPGQLVPSFVEAQTGQYLSFRMGFNEAVVLAGKTPPAVKYFSYGAYLASRSSEDTGGEVRRFKVTPIRNSPTVLEKKALSRDIVFGCLGNPVNSLTISTPGTPGGAPGCSGGQPFFLVFTGSEELAKSVLALAETAGFPPESLNCAAIAEDLVRFGVTTQDTDTFSIINRISSGEGGGRELSAYLSDPGVRVLRVTANRITGPALPIPGLTPRGTGKTELRLLKAVERLRTEIIGTYAGDYEAVDIPTDVWLEESFTSLQQKLDNLGESRDAAYFASGSFRLPEDAFVVAYGANHAKTGKSSYCNAVVYGKKYDNGVVGVSNEDFDGSASDYLDGDEAAYLYAWRFGFGENPSAHYTEIPACAGDAAEAPDGRHTRRIDPEEDIYLGFRAYLEPTTKTGPAWNELILDRALVFLKR